MILLKILLWLLLALVLLLAAALVMPAVITVRYRDGELAELKARLLFLSIDLKNPPRFKKRKEAPAADPAPEKKPPKTLLQKLADVKKYAVKLPELMEPSGVLLKKLFSKIRITDIDLMIAVGGKSPEAVGTNTGMVWAAVGTVFGALGIIFNLTVKNVTVLPDFGGEHKNAVLFSAKAKGSLLSVGTAVLTFLIRVKSVLNPPEVTTPIKNNEEGNNNEQ